jgi:hypothetical protein
MTKPTWHAMSKKRLGNEFQFIICQLVFDPLSFRIPVRTDCPYLGSSPLAGKSSLLGRASHAGLVSFRLISTLYFTD